MTPTSKIVWGRSRHKAYPNRTFQWDFFFWDLERCIFVGNLSQERITLDHYKEISLEVTSCIAKLAAIFNDRGDHKVDENLREIGNSVTPQVGKKMPSW